MGCNGVFDGCDDGSVEGSSDGWKDGCFVGLREGCDDGFEGEEDGIRVGLVKMVEKLAFGTVFVSVEKMVEATVHI